jgi:hypothetical protein
MDHHGQLRYSPDAMRGATVAEPHAEQPDPEHRASDFEVLNADLSLKVPTHKAPNPLRNARPERLQVVRDDVRRIIAARRAGLQPPER